MTVAFSYGGGGTIHRTEQVNVERDPNTGEVVSVWFRCLPLPFTDTVCNQARADDMRRMYTENKMPRIQGIIAEKDE